MKIAINVPKEIEKAADRLDDCIKSLTVLDNAIASKVLEDKHSLEIQKWIKEYKLKIEVLRMFIDNARSNGK